MNSNLEKIKNEFSISIESANSIEILENLRIAYLGKKGVITALFLDLKNLNLEEKKKAGAELNQIKTLITEELEKKKEQLELVIINQKLAEENLDLTIPPRLENRGIIHPISKVMQEIEQIFKDMDFELATGPEIEDDFHNFTALNMAQDHPARQMQDTFYLAKSNILLRTHTSNVQIRKMLETKPPLRIISMGKVYRHDSDQTHTPMFHQIEGLVIDKDVNIGHLKWILEKFLQKFFAISAVPMRFRPSFFPFTEPSAELDIGYSKKDGQIKIGGNENFLEILGCGMVHPFVLKNVNIDPNQYQGFAFGIGIERLAMLKYGINDLRMFFESDLRFLKHYGFSIPNS